MAYMKCAVLLIISVSIVYVYKIYTRTLAVVCMRTGAKERETVDKELMRNLQGSLKRNVWTLIFRKEMYVAFDWKLMIFCCRTVVNLDWILPCVLTQMLHVQCFSDFNQKLVR